jgi:hypothetical protein
MRFNYSKLKIPGFKDSSRSYGIKDFTKISCGTPFGINWNETLTLFYQNNPIMKRTASLLSGVIILFLTASFVLKGDTSNMEGKVYKITITEQKSGKSGKAEQADCSFKSSKFKCKFFGQNAGAEEIPIDLDKDSTYSEEGSDVELMYVEFSGERTNKLEEVVKVTGTVDGYGIEGSVELSKKGKVKKHWDFVGTQKDKKK